MLTIIGVPVSQKRLCVLLKVLHFVLLITLGILTEAAVIHGQEVSNRQPLTLSGDCLLSIPGEFLGHVGPWALDTGCSRNLVDYAFAKEFKGRKEEDEIFVTAESKVHAVALFDATIQLADQSKFKDLVIAVNLDNLNKHRSTAVLGILGTLFFWYDRVSFNSNSGAVEIGDTSVLDGYIAIPISIKKNLAYVNINLDNSQKITALIDTGFNGNLTIDQASFDALKADGKMASLGKHRYSTVYQDSWAEHGVIREVTIQDLRFKNVDISVGNKCRVGLGLLKQQDFAFNLSEGILWIRDKSTALVAP